MSQTGGEEAVKAAIAAIERVLGDQEWLLRDGGGVSAMAGLRRALPCHCPACMFKALIALAGVAAQHVPREQVDSLLDLSRGALAMYAGQRRQPYNDRYFGRCVKPDDVPPHKIDRIKIPPLIEK
jgi:hypothetical protein